MKNSTPLDTLQEKISDTMRRLPGAASFFLFGSAAHQQTRDTYSDLDVQVVSDDFEVSKPYFLSFLEKIGPVEAAYLLETGENELAYSVAYANESPFHKVDIGVSSQTRSLDRPTFFDTLDRKVLLWKQQPVFSADRAEHTVYVPVPGSPAYFLVGELFSAVRYVKSRKRRRHLLCWRFLSAKVNALLNVLWWAKRGGDIPKRLNTVEISNLDHLLEETDRSDLLRVVDCREPERMDEALVKITRQITEQIRPSLQGDDLRAAQIADHYLAFLQQELS